MRRFRALFHWDAPTKRGQWRKAGRNLFVARTRRGARPRGTAAAHLVLRVLFTKPARPSESLRSRGKSTIPIQHRARSIVSAGRATDSYEFGWHPVLNKSRKRTLSGHKIYGTSRETCKRAAEFYFGKNSLPKTQRSFICGVLQFFFLIFHIK